MKEFANKHPYLTVIGGLFALAIVFNNVADAIDKDVRPDSMTCHAVGHEPGGLSISIGLGDSKDISLAVPSDSGAALHFVCEAD